jgi:hypothetical protein
MRSVLDVDHAAAAFTADAATGTPIPPTATTIAMATNLFMVLSSRLVDLGGTRPLSHLALVDSLPVA